MTVDRLRIRCFAIKVKDIPSSILLRITPGRQEVFHTQDAAFTHCSYDLVFSKPIAFQVKTPAFAAVNSYDRGSKSDERDYVPGPVVPQSSRSCDTEPVFLVKGHASKFCDLIFSAYGEKRKEYPPIIEKKHSWRLWQTVRPFIRTVNIHHSSIRESGLINVGMIHRPVTAIEDHLYFREHDACGKYESDNFD
jgi:hypothetical protein